MIAHVPVIKLVHPSLCGNVAGGRTKCISIPLLHCRWVVTDLVWCDLTHQKDVFQSHLLFVAPSLPVHKQQWALHTDLGWWIIIPSPYYYKCWDPVFSVRSLAECSFAAWVFFYLDMCCSPVNMILECHLKQLNCLALTYATCCVMLYQFI